MRSSAFSGFRRFCGSVFSLFSVVTGFSVRRSYVSLIWGFVILVVIGGEFSGVLGFGGFASSFGFSGGTYSSGVSSVVLRCSEICIDELRVGRASTGFRSCGMNMDVFRLSVFTFFCRSSSSFFVSFWAKG